MLIPLTLIILAVVVWLVWQWRSGALLDGASKSPAASPATGRRSDVIPETACDPRPQSARPYLVAQRRGLVWRSTARDAA